ncbi:MAG: hypothetical protein ACKVH8_22675, partial [Pirellulales bacterium]
SIHHLKTHFFRADYVRHAEEFQRSRLFNQLASKHNNYSVILVVDECEPKECAEIWNRLSNYADRCKVISIGHTSYELSVNEFQELECPPLEEEKIAAIIQSYTNNRVEVRHWAELCGGSPRVAQAVGENLQGNTGDILEAPSMKLVWEKFIAGYQDINSDAAQNKLHVLRHIALFQKFGYERPVRNEADYIISLIQKVDSNFTPRLFNQAVVELRKQKILQGSKTLFIAPKLLHVDLWKEFWDIYGESHSLVELVNTIPDSLIQWFTGMFSYAGTSDVAKRQAKSLLSHGGPLRDSSFALFEIGGRIFHELSNAAPEETLSCLEYVIGQVDHERLKNYTGGRQDVVWALERIAMWPDLFYRAAMVLRTLALAENADNSNNATGTFVGLFSLATGRGAPTGATPKERLPVLVNSLEISSDEIKHIGIKACHCAISREVGYRFIGPGIQGLQVAVQWTPETWEEIYAAKKQYWKLLHNESRKWDSGLRKTANAALIDAASSMLYKEPLCEFVLETLDELIEDDATELQSIIELVSSKIRFQEEHLSEVTIERLKELEVRITGTTLAHRVRRYVLCCSMDDYYDDFYDDDDVSMKVFNQRLTDLAREAVESESDFLGVLPDLVRGENNAVFHFACELSTYDNLKYWPLILESYREQKGVFTSLLIGGYVARLYHRDQCQWKEIVKELILDDLFSSVIGEILHGSGLTDDILLLLFQEIRNGRIEKEQLTKLSYSQALDNLSELAFLAYIVELTLDARFKCAFQTFQRRYKSHNGLLPEKNTYLFLQKYGESKSEDADYYWSQIAERYLNENPEKVMDLFSIILNKAVLADWFDFNSSRVYKVFKRIVSIDTEGCWQCFVTFYEKLEPLKKSSLIYWLGPRITVIGEAESPPPLLLFPIKNVFNWIDEDPEGRAYDMSQIVPKSLADDDAGSWTRELLLRYGNDSGVSSGLLTHFSNDGWSGSASHHYRKRRKTAREWLDGEKSMQIRTWLEQYIAYLNSNIDRAELDEERGLW